MALDSQNVSISFSKGVDTKSDPKQVIAGKLLTLENGQLQTTGEVKKRSGFAQIGSGFNSSNLLTTYQNELISDDNFTLYSYDQKQNLNHSKGTKVAIDLSAQSIIKNAYQQTVPDYGFNSNIGVYAWEDTRGGVRASIIDEATGNAIISDQLINVGAVKPKVMSIGRFIIIIYYDSINLDFGYVSIDTLSPNGFSGFTRISLTISNANPIYDACASASRIYITFYKSGGGVSFCYLDSVLNLSSVTTAGSDVLTTLGCFFDTILSQVWFCYVTNANAVKYLIRDSGLGSFLSPTTVQTASDIRNINGYAVNGTGNLFYEQASTYSTNPKSYSNIIKSSVNNAGTTSVIGYIIRGVGLASKVFIQNSNDAYFLAAHDSPLQPTYFVVNSSGHVVTKIAYLNGGGLTAKASVLPEVTTVSTDNCKFPYLFKDNTQSVGGTLTSLTQKVPNFVTTTGINSALLTYRAPLVATQIANDLHLSGGIVSLYDGASVSELGYNLDPEDVGSNMGSGNVVSAGSLATNSVYSYLQTYEWQDNQGQIHRSAPNSIALTVDSTSSIKVSGQINTSIFIFNIPSADLIRGITIGMSVSGTGIPAGTTVLDIDALNSSDYRIKLSQNTTATSTDTFSFDSHSLATASYKTGQKLLTVDNTTALYIAAASGEDANGTYLSVNDSALRYLSVGLTVKDMWGVFGTATQTITSISGNKIYLSSALLPGTPTTASYFKITGTTFYGTASLRVGQRFTASDFTGDVTIVSINEVGGVAEATVDVPANATNTSQTLTISNIQANVVNCPTLKITDKINSPVQIIVWRTENQQSVYRRVSSLTNPIINDTTVDFIPFVDTMSDLQLDGNNQIYTTGELPNSAPPAASDFTLYYNRLILLSSEDPLEWYYSKQVIGGQGGSTGAPVEFGQGFSNLVDQRGGNNIKVAAMDDKLIFFKRKNIFYVTGDGPTASGTLNTFSEAQIISSDVGCINKKSVVLMPSGLMFQSAKGIYLLTRSLEVKYIGSDVEAYNSQTITSANLVDDLNQVRFTLNSGVCLMYDYYANQWGVFTNINANDATIFQNKFTHITPGGVTNQETPGVYNDNGSFIKLKLVTSWLSFAQLQGYERIWNMLLLGEYKSAHSLVVKFAYDFISTFTQTTTIPVTSSVVPYEFRVPLTRQKCTALQISIEDSQTNPIGEGYSISALGLEVGVKKGLNKLPASKTYSA